MRKLEYIDFIRNSLLQVDKTSKYHPKQVGVALNMAVNSMFYELWDNNPKMFIKSMERYTTVISKIPTTNATTGRYEVDIGSDVVDLKRKTGGILDIMTATTTTTIFIPVSVIEGNQFYGAESSLPDNVIGYSWNGSQSIEFWNISAAQAAAGVVIRLIKQFHEMGDTDDVLLPYGQDERIIELVRQFLGAIPPKDIINSNADIQANE